MTIIDHRPSDLEIEPTASKISFAPSRHLWAVLLAGGDGIRLRDLTRRIAGDSRPKQFCRVMGDESLFRQTRTRLQPLFRRDHQVFVVSRAHEPYYCEDLADTSDSCVIEQPLNRGTGIAIGLATLHVLLRDPDAIVSFFPCDHYYSDDNSFRSTVRSAAACVQRHPESIILIGAEAEYPEIEYGWIEPGAGSPADIERLTGDAQSVFLVLLAIARDVGWRGALPGAVREAMTRLGTDVATALAAMADRVQGREAAPPIDVDEALGALERSVSAHGELGDDSEEAWRARLALYRELVATYAHDFASPILALKPSVNG